MVDAAPMAVVDLQRRPGIHIASSASRRKMAKRDAKPQLSGDKVCFSMVHDAGLH